MKALITLAVLFTCTEALALPTGKRAHFPMRAVAIVEAGTIIATTTAKAPAWDDIVVDPIIITTQAESADALIAGVAEKGSLTIDVVEKDARGKMVPAYTIVLTNVVVCAKKGGGHEQEIDVYMVPSTAKCDQ